MSPNGYLTFTGCFVSPTRDCGSAFLLARVVSERGSSRAGSKGRHAQRGGVLAGAGPVCEPVPPVEAFLAHLQALNRSPTTVRTHATSLKLWLEFLARVEVGIDAARIEHMPRFLAWLRAPAENVIVLDGGQGHCSPVTVNRHLVALFSFYDYRARQRGGARAVAGGVAPQQRRRLPAHPAPCHRRPTKPDPAVGVASIPSAAADSDQRTDHHAGQGA